MVTEAKSAHASSETGAFYSVLVIERLRGKGSVPIAVVILDAAGDKLYLRFREDLADIADPEALEVLEGMADTIMSRAREEGAVRLWRWFLDTLSGYVQMEEPQAIAVPIDWKEATDRLFMENVNRAVGRS